MPLPAPYAPPWKRLWEDGVAMAAWLQLKARELWRRNGDGSLPLPPFWPRRWAQLFWPLAIAALLLAVLALARPWQVGSGASPAGSSPSAEESLAPGVERTEPEKPEPLLEALPQEGGVGGAEGTPEDEPKPELADGKQPSEEMEEAPSEVALLRAEWSPEDPEHLLEAILPEPADATLSLGVTERFLTLAAANRQRWADRWQARAAELGYNHLELVDGEQRLLGRDAQVGSGMILFQPRERPHSNDPFRAGARVGAADAGGSPARDGLGGGSDGMVGSAVGGAGGPLGSAPGGSPRPGGARGGGKRIRWWRSGADGGEHRQPPVASR